MKVCKFEKIKDEDEMKQVINCIQKEHPYVAVVPILAQLQEWLQAISISWFHEEDEVSHTTVNAIEAYCCTLATNPEFRIYAIIRTFMSFLLNCSII